MNRRDLLNAVASLPLVGAFLLPKVAQAAPVQGAVDGNHLLQVGRQSRTARTDEDVARELQAWCEYGMETVVTAKMDRVSAMPYSPPLVYAPDPGKIVGTVIGVERIAGKGCTRAEAMADFRARWHEWRAANPGESLFWRAIPIIKQREDMATGNVAFLVYARAGVWARREEVGKDAA